jgi:hypothetical protein
MLYDSTNARPFRIDKKAGDFLFAYSTIHDYDMIYDTAGSSKRRDTLNFDYIVRYSNIDSNNIYREDPMYANPALNDFTIPSNSPLYSVSSIGGAIGDPRWAPFDESRPIIIEPILEKVWPGKDYQMSVVVDLPDGADQTVTWSVANEHGGTSGAATIDANGLLSATAVGDVKVIATSNYNQAFYDTLIVTIEEQVLVTSIALVSSEDVLVGIGSFATLTATILPENADVKDITWSVSDDAAANIIVKTPTTAEIVAKVDDGTVVTVTATADDGSGIKGTVDVKCGDKSSISIASANDIQIMPNPASDYITIKSEQRSEVTITNILGSVVLTDVVEPGEVINIAELEAGMYMVTVKSNNIDNTVRLIKE